MTYDFVNSLPFHLNRVGVRLAELFSTQLAEHELTVPMYRALAVLHQNGPQTLTDLSDLTKVELSTLSRLVGTLVKRGLTLRRRPVENGRIVRIELTEAGIALTQEVMPIARHYEKLATAGIPDETIDEVKRVLGLIYANLDDVRGGSGRT